jgi:hypothetical protein
MSESAEQTPDLTSANEDVEDGSVGESSDAAKDQNGDGQAVPSESVTALNSSEGQTGENEENTSKFSGCQSGEKAEDPKETGERTFTMISTK